MRRLKGIDLGGNWQAQAVGVLRPSVEAALLAGVALGCAQIGWEALTAPTADASASAPVRPEEGAQVVEVRSPFAPTDSEVSHASATLVANVGLAGVRMAEDPARSGAILTLEGGQQRAFIVGQEVAHGVTLGAVMADRVLLNYDGGSKELALAPASSSSYALALMGRGSIDAAQIVPVSAPPAPIAQPTTPFEVASQPETLGVLAPAPTSPVAVSPSQVSAAAQSAGLGAAQADIEWLASTMSQIEQAESGASGWRIGSEPPAIVAEAGLRQGDLILSINGAGPESGVDLASAIGGGPVEVAVERGGKRLSVSIETSGRS